MNVEISTLGTLPLQPVLQTEQHGRRWHNPNLDLRLCPAEGWSWCMNTRYTLKLCHKIYIA